MLQKTRHHSGLAQMAQLVSVSMQSSEWDRSWVALAFPETSSAIDLVHTVRVLQRQWGATDNLFQSPGCLVIPPCYDVNATTPESSVIGNDDNDEAIPRVRNLHLRPILVCAREHWTFIHETVNLYECCSSELKRAHPVPIYPALSDAFFRCDTEDDSTLRTFALCVHRLMNAHSSRRANVVDPRTSTSRSPLSGGHYLRDWLPAFLNRFQSEDHLKRALWDTFSHERDCFRVSKNKQRILSSGREPNLISSLSAMLELDQPHWIHIRALRMLREIFDGDTSRGRRLFQLFPLHAELVNWLCRRSAIVPATGNRVPIPSGFVQGAAATSDTRDDCSPQIEVPTVDEPLLWKSPIANLTGLDRPHLLLYHLCVRDEINDLEAISLFLGLSVEKNWVTHPGARVQSIVPGKFPLPPELGYAQVLGAHARVQWTSFYTRPLTLEGLGVQETSVHQLKTVRDMEHAVARQETHRLAREHLSTFVERRNFPLARVVYRGTANESIRRAIRHDRDMLVPFTRAYKAEALHQAAHTHDAHGAPLVISARVSLPVGRLVMLVRLLEDLHQHPSMLGPGPDGVPLDQVGRDRAPTFRLWGTQIHLGPPRNFLDADRDYPLEVQPDGTAVYSSNVFPMQTSLLTKTPDNCRVACLPEYRCLRPFVTVDRVFLHAVICAPLPLSSVQ
jgi:hypothetical protein